MAENLKPSASALTITQEMSLGRSVVEVLRFVDQHLASLPFTSFSTGLRKERDHFRFVISPSNARAAKIELYFYVGEIDRLGLSAGMAAFLDIPRDLHGVHCNHWVDFVQRTICAVIDGRFQETLRYKGGILTRRAFTIKLSDEESFGFTRSSVSAALRTVWRRSDERVLTYVPYEGA